MKRIFYSLLVLIIVVWSMPVNSATVNYDGGYLSGISDLDIGAAQYDVDFIFDSFENIWPSPSLPQFWGDESSAREAETAITNALNGEAVSPRFNDDVNDNYYLIPYDSYYSFGTYIDSVEGFRNDDPPFEWIYGGRPSHLSTESKYYAKFSGVPIPSAVWLLGFGLIAFVGIRRKL